MVSQFFERLRLWGYRFRRFFAKRFFKRPLTTEELNSYFLKTTSKLTYDGTVEIYRGGMRTFQELLIDENNAVYILVVKTNHRKRMNLKNWFREYGKRGW